MRLPVVVLIAIACTAAVAGCAPAEPSNPPAAMAAVGGELAPKGPVARDVPVERVVDGDTVKVLVDGRSVTVRMIGIDTPETVKPGAAVECFGPEASAFAREALEGSRVTLELDPSQGDVDRYGRTLAYVWRQLDDGTLSMFNIEAVRGGYAVERQYADTPYAWRGPMRDAARQARAAGAGLWGAC